ncbi:OLC1v1027510C1 [Oldenlandia corymbosa var. corymbosa]|uniref:OLC1v1027510C1 n=1 Tax=Oldenlandia corymbosa var. corymbosa TaxID=529605 RepID=A0AAV1C9X1_OLDCO|nr:OLC1v1027510C1 [Oldenlandia corymbosa var. corymbosa]
MLIIEPPTAAGRFPSRSFDHNPTCISHSATFFVPRNQYRRLIDQSCAKSSNRKRSGIWASAAKELPSSSSGPVKPNAKPQRYHPFEDISDSELNEDGEAILNPAETTRTVIEVNSKATLMFSSLVNDQVHENIFWPDLPYVTDEHGNIYFRVKNDEDILQTLSSDENLVQVIIGLDTAEVLSEMESLGQTEIAFDLDEFDDEDSDVDDEDDEDEDEDADGYEKDWVAIIDNEEDEESDSDESLGDWAKLETMRASHPMYFARKLSEAASDDPIDFMEQPPAGIAIQGLLRPAIVEEHTVIQKQISDNHSSDNITDKIVKMEGHKEEDATRINGHKHQDGSAQEGLQWMEESETDEASENGTSFYKLEMVKIQLISAHGHQSFVELEDFRRAQPDAIAHSAAKIISRIKAGGEKTIQALKSLCWRCKGIQVEEVALIGIDSLGFDLRVCSGTQVQTLRFSFSKRASSEYSAERQLNSLIFPRSNHKQQQKKEAQQTEL